MTIGQVIDAWIDRLPPNAGTTTLYFVVLALWFKLYQTFVFTPHDERPVAFAWEEPPESKWVRVGRVMIALQLTLCCKQAGLERTSLAGAHDHFTRTRSDAVTARP